MNKFLITAMITFAAIGYAMTANAATFGPVVDTTELERSLTAVCESEVLVLSPDARAICDTQQFPALTADGNLANRGVGAEFNVLMRQTRVLDMEAAGNVISTTE